MSIIVDSRPWERQPRRHARLNRHHPLAAKHVMSWNGDMSTNGIALGKREYPLTRTNVLLDDGGTGFGSTVTTGVFFGSTPYSDPLAFADTQEVSVVALLRIDGQGGGSFGRLIDRSSGSFGANGYCVYPRSSEIRLAVNGSELFISMIGTDYPYQQGKFVLGVDIKSGAQKIYTRGIYQSGASSAITWYAGSSAISTCIGNWNHSTGREFDGAMWGLHLFTPVLTEAEHAVIANDFWGLWL